MEVVASIEDLIAEILARVPARPLVRFKCVSKHWLSLISDPKFCHRHTLQNPRSSVSAVFPKTSFGSTALSFIHLDHGRPRSNQSSANCNPLKFVPNEITVIQSCNGLFLCCPMGTSRSSYYVLNPTTNQFSTLMPQAGEAAATTYGQSYVRDLTQALAFDPSRSPHYKLLVFWTNLPIDMNNQNYQIITTHRLRDINLDFNIDIYSSETKSWRLVNSSVSMPHNFFFTYAEGVYCNDAVHWLESNQNQLLYYHIDDERVGHVDHNGYSELSDSSFLQESHCGSHLHLIEIYLSTVFIPRIEVSEMKRDYSGWCLKYHIDLRDIIPKYRWSHMTEVVAVLFLTPEETEGEESSSLLLHIPGQVISYNLKSKISKYFQLTPRQGIDDNQLRVTSYNFQYMETLACV
uniref:F-box protein At5g07610-like n=1 Tax=Fragaria vesca subsp. vesca TaxID=101020 RepID=UPI0005C95180|nr:PREDICTED: F-box protein At5g07610-like [Fragaria vesca subsp. vesca]